jgi:hypothetical protein
MKRRLLNLAAAVSLVLFLATVGLWVRSYWVGDNVSWSSSHAREGDWVSREWMINIGRGGWLIQWIDSLDEPTGAPRPNSDPWRWSHPRAPASVGGGAHLPSFWRRRGFSYSSTGPMNRPGRVQHRYLCTPLWFLAALTSPVPLLWLCRRRLQAKRNRDGERGLCPNCGYDLRATPDRCPECGQSPFRVPPLPSAECRGEGPPT